MPSISFRWAEVQGRSFVQPIIAETGEIIDGVFAASVESAVDDSTRVHLSAHVQPEKDVRIATDKP